MRSATSAIRVSVNPRSAIRLAAATNIWSRRTSAPAGALRAMVPPRRDPPRTPRSDPSGSSRASDVAQVALVELVDPRVLRREHAVVEGTRGHPTLDALADLVVLPGHEVVE